MVLLNGGGGFCQNITSMFYDWHKNVILLDHTIKFGASKGSVKSWFT